VASFTPQLLYSQGRSPRYPLYRKLVGSQSRSGRGGEKNSQPLSGIEPPDYPALSPALYHRAIPYILILSFTLRVGIPIGSFQVF
jgi:hypothetical protein